MFKQARWMLLAAVVLAGGLMGARPASANERQGLPHHGLPQRHFGTVLGDHMDHRCCGYSRICDHGTDKKVTCCAYVACCESGNRGFFTPYQCYTCDERSGAPVHTGQGSCCCNSPKGETERYY